MPSHHSSAARRTNSASHGEPMKVSALSGQAIDVRRLDVGMLPMAAEIAPAPVIGEDKEDVCLCRAGRYESGRANRHGEKQCDIQIHGLNDLTPLR